MRQFLLKKRICVILEHNRLDKARDFVNKYFDNIIFAIYELNHETDQLRRVKFDNRDDEQGYFEDSVIRDASPFLSSENKNRQIMIRARRKEGQEEGAVCFIMPSADYDRRRFIFVAQLVTTAVAEYFYRRRAP